ncbi:hypothetical protein TRP66_18360 [Pseudomonas sp. JDS28PS106]|uniref:hypothetical protein n=1 Tax=Pseudomonas sp. JDS28PS106 TaxID=2497235 RepID=UPI002FD52061
MKFETLEQAHIQGAMSGVKLVSVHKDVLPIVLSDEVAGATFPAIEALWEPIKELDLNQRLEVDFSCEHEVYSGRSEYLFWSAVKEVLESNSLGIERYETPVLHDCTEEISSGDDPSSHQHHLDIRQPFSSEAVMPTGFCPHVLEHVDSIVGHSSSSMLECYVCPPQKWKMP